MIVLPMVVSILMPTSQSEAAGKAGLGWWGALGEAAAAAEILKSSGRSGSQPRNFLLVHPSFSVRLGIVQPLNKQSSKEAGDKSRWKVSVSISKFLILCPGGRTVHPLTEQ